MLRLRGLPLPVLAAVLALAGVEGANGATTRIIDAHELNVLAPPQTTAPFNPERTAIVPVRIKVVVLCTIAVDGRLTNCRVLKERPRGWRAGQYAIRMAESMRVSTTLKDGSDGVGALVKVPFTIE